MQQKTKPVPNGGLSAVINYSTSAANRNQRDFYIGDLKYLQMVGRNGYAARGWRWHFLWESTAFFLKSGGCLP